MSILNRAIVSMAAINFPSDPAFGAEFINGDVTYIWDEYAWHPRELTPSKNFTTIQYQLFLKYARISELDNDIVLTDTFSRITEES